MEQMQLKYHKEAAERGVYIVSACGFDSIPTDLGIIFLEKEFKGQVNSVETYLESSVVGDVDKVFTELSLVLSVSASTSC